MRTNLSKIVVLVVAFALLLTFAPPILATEGDVEINETNFPDDAFREFVTQYYDTNGDGTLQVAELEAVTEIVLDDDYVTNIIGIKYFTNLASLTCFCRELEDLDVTGCANLESLLIADADYIESLDVSNCTNLRKLMCFMCLELNSLNVSGCTKLESLICAHTSVEELDVSSLTNLKKLICSYSPVRSLDLSACQKLVTLNVYRASLDNLDLSEQKELQKLDTSMNCLAVLDVSGLPLLWQFTAGEQYGEEVIAVRRGDQYVADLSSLEGVDIARIKDIEVSFYDEGLLPTGYTYNKTTGLLTIDVDPGQSEFVYVYDTKANLKNLDKPPAGYDPPGYAEYDEEEEFDEEKEEEEDWRYRDSSPDLEVRFTINIVEESPEAPVVLETEDDNVEIGEDGVVIFQQREQSEDETAEDVTEGGISLKIEGNVDDFQYVTLNGQRVARQHYDVKEGSIIVTLKDAFLSSLPPGEYVVKLFTKAFVNSQNILLVAPEPEPAPDSEVDKQLPDVTESDSKPLIIDIPSDLNEGNDIVLANDGVVEYFIGKSNGITFKVSFEGSDALSKNDFRSLTVDGEEIEQTPDNYTVEDGSIIVKLTKRFLDNLPKKEHSIGIHTEQGSVVKIIRRIEADPETTTSDSPDEVIVTMPDKMDPESAVTPPATGEVKYNHVWWAALLLLSVGAVLLFTSSSIRREGKQRR